MKVLIAFIFTMFLVAAWFDHRGRTLRFRWIFLAAALTSLSFLSLRVVT